MGHERISVTREDAGLPSGMTSYLVIEVSIMESGSVLLAWACLVVSQALCTGCDSRASGHGPGGRLLIPRSGYPLDGIRDLYE